MTDRYDRYERHAGYDSAVPEESVASGTSSVEAIAPVVPAVLLFVGMLPVTWLLPSLLGYVLAGGFVCFVLAYALAVEGLPTRLSPVAILLGLYWLLLIPQFAVTGQLSFLPYIALTPLMILALVVLAPKLIERDPTRFVVALTSIVTALTAIGVLLLAASHLLDMEFPMTARGILGLYPYRISSLYANSNYFGFAAAVGALSALYLALERREQLWSRLFVVLVIATLLSNNRTALVAVALASVVLLKRSHVDISRRLRLAAVGGLALGALLILAYPDRILYFELAWTSLYTRFEAWEVVLLEATDNPFLGAGFGTEITTHNSYLAILLHSGFVAGWLYNLAIAAALLTGAIRMVTGDLWDAYVFAALLLIAVYLSMESATIGGLTSSSLLIALYLGLASKPDGESFAVDLRTVRSSITGSNRTENG